MADRFTYDVFLSHNSKDKPRVRALAEDLRAAGLRVWFDEWVIKPGDDIYLAIERGLEAARAQVLCLSPAALGSEWVTLERSTAVFRDPSNAGRRFIPLLLADCELPDAVRRYKYVDYRRKTKTAFAELLAACQSEAGPALPAPKVKAAKKPLRAMPPRHSDRIDIEFWANIDLEPLERAFEQEIIGQQAVKRGILNSLRSYSSRCRELLRRNPSAVKTAHDERYRLPVISLFGAVSGMGKTTCCRVMAQHLFDNDGLAAIIDLSGTYVSTKTRGVPPPYVGWDQESTLIRFARESRGLGLVCFDEITRVQGFNQEPLAHSLSPFVELLQNRSFVPVSPRFVPPEGRYHMANSVFVFLGHVNPPGAPVPAGSTSIEALGGPLARLLAESDSIFYFEPLRDEDLRSATALALRSGARRWAVDFMPHLAQLTDGAVIEAEFLDQLSALIWESIRRSGAQPSLAFVQGQVAHLPYKRSFDALARHDGQLILGRELLDPEALP